MIGGFELVTVSGDPRKAGQAKSPAGTGAEESPQPRGGGVLGNLQLPPGFDPSKFKLPGQ